MSIAAIVPMRHSSERVEGKNYRMLGGRPLFHHVIDSLNAVEAIDEIVIDTDSDTISADAAQHYPSVRVLRRPEHLRDGEVPMNDVLINTVSQLEHDYYLQTHSTNPLVRPETFAGALSRFGEPGTHDSLFGVTRVQARLWQAGPVPLNHDPAHLLRTQDLEPVFMENSCVYVFMKGTLESCGNRIGKSPVMFEIDPGEAMDIDEERDFKLVERMIGTGSW